jgi:SOUL heme-binding protein
LGLLTPSFFLVTRSAQAIRVKAPREDKKAGRAHNALMIALLTRRRRLLIAFSLSLSLLPMSTFAIEEPAYQVLRKVGDVELRRYAPYVVAEVLVPGPADEAGNQAFPILAGYIFGKNKGEKKLEMTAPVTQALVPMRMDMTAPVTQARAGDKFVVQFVLPKDITLTTAPEPTDERVQLRVEAAYSVAVIRYSGFWSQANYAEQLAKLQATLKAADVEWTGEPVLSRYDPPFMPWFLRRNEVWLRLR